MPREKSNGAKASPFYHALNNFSGDTEALLYVYTTHQKCPKGAEKQKYMDTKLQQQKLQGPRTVWRLLLPLSLIRCRVGLSDIIYCNNEHE